MRRPVFIHFFKSYQQVYPQLSTYSSSLTTTFPQKNFTLYTEIIHFFHKLSTESPCCSIGYTVLLK